MIPEPKFPMGQLYCTPGVLQQVSHIELDSRLSQHRRCDWGDLCEEDKKRNDLALKHGGRLFSAYTCAPNTKIWIITEADRSATTILLPEEY